MKTIVILITLALFTMNGYSQKTDVNNLLENKETRTAIFNSITGSHELMADFMAVAKTNEHAMMMIKEGNTMMGQSHQMGMENKGLQMHGDHKMMGAESGMMMNNPEQMQMMMEHMMKMCDQDSVLRSKMCSMMAEHPKMMETMKDQTEQKGSASGRHQHK